MLAYLENRGKTYFARREPSYGLISTPITALVRGIHSRFPEIARSLVRARVFTDEPSSELGYGTVAVCAKRLSFLETAPTPQADWIEIFEPEFPKPISRPDFLDPMRIAETLKEQSGRAVGAVLVSSDGEILSWGINRSFMNPCFHAEIETLFHLCKSRSKIPKNASLYVTRKPCKMCAGTFWRLAEDIESNRIYFLEDGAGPLERITVFTPGSFERKRAGKGEFKIEFPYSPRNSEFPALHPTSSETGRNEAIPPRSGR